MILNEFRGRFGNYFRFIFFFLIIKRYNLVVPKNFSAKSNFHIQISFPQISASTLISNSYNISNQATNITTRKYFSFKVTTFNLDFGGGLTGSGKTSAAESVNILRAECEKGWYQLEPFQSYTGVKGKASDGTLLNTYIENQQARQMDDDALSIINNRPMMVTGEEGLKDIAIVEAINKSAQTGSPVTL